MLSLTIAGLEVAATIRLQKPQKARGHPRGPPKGIEINPEVVIPGNILPLPCIVWVKDKEIVIIDKPGLAPPVGELQEAVQGHREAQEVPGNQWVPGVPEVPEVGQVRTEILIIINTILTMAVQANP